MSCEGRLIEIEASDRRVHQACRRRIVVRQHHYHAILRGMDVELRVDAETSAAVAVDPLTVRLEDREAEAVAGESEPRIGSRQFAVAGPERGARRPRYEPIREQRLAEAQQVVHGAELPMMRRVIG
jgi:hypothetical protein